MESQKHLLHLKNKDFSVTWLVMSSFKTKEKSRSYTSEK